MQQLDTDVLVVGSGLTGATAALLLARYGMRTIMITKSRWVADSPRAHITNQRTMEVMRASASSRRATTRQPRAR